MELALYKALTAVPTALLDMRIAYDQEPRADDWPALKLRQQQLAEDRWGFLQEKAQLEREWLAGEKVARKERLARLEKHQWQQKARKAIQEREELKLRIAEFLKPKEQIQEEHGPSKALYEIDRLKREMAEAAEKH